MNDQSAALQRALPEYQCHKRVYALRIERIESCDVGANIHPTDRSYGPIHVTTEWCVKHRPQAGGYWVRYQDGYESFSPAKAFEDGYSLVTPTTYSRTPIVGV